VEKTLTVKIPPRSVSVTSISRVPGEHIARILTRSNVHNNVHYIHHDAHPIHRSCHRLQRKSPHPK
jgi:hypothetical protein